MATEPVEKQLRRKLTGLRISQSRTRSALCGAGEGEYSRKYREKLEQVNGQISLLEAQLRDLAASAVSPPTNLFGGVPTPLSEELVQTLLHTSGFRVER